MPFFITKCQICSYTTNIKCNLIRHQNAKHKDYIFDKSGILIDGQNVPSDGQNVPPDGQNVPPINYCKKCNKGYKTKKHLYNHELNCKGVDELTCSKCMVSFTTRQHKYNHTKRNNCKAKSIIHARIPNHNPNTNTTIHNTTNNIQNNTTNNIQNHIYINNIGSERIDHITNDEIIKILTSGINTIPSYIKMKHFDKNFPENNNIIYTNENKCKVMEDNEWLEKDLGLLSNKLIKDNTEVLLLYYDDNKVEIGESINDTDIFDNVKNKLILIYNKQDVNKYNQVLSKIKELIKNFKED